MGVELVEVLRLVSTGSPEEPWAVVECAAADGAEHGIGAAGAERHGIGGLDFVAGAEVFHPKAGMRVAVAREGEGICPRGFAEVQRVTGGGTVHVDFHGAACG